jgi:hypothetical protein
MRLKTKLEVSASVVTFALVLMLSALFVSELMRQRIEQTVAANDMLAHQIYLMTRQAGGGSAGRQKRQGVTRSGNECIT